MLHLGYYVAFWSAEISVDNNVCYVYGKDWKPRRSFTNTDLWNITYATYATIIIYIYIYIYYFLLLLSSLTYQPLVSNHTTEERDQIILWKSRVAHVQRKGIISPTITKSICHSLDTIFKLMVIKEEEEEEEEEEKKKPVTVPQHGNCVSLNRMFSHRRKKKNYCYMDQIQPTKHSMG